MKHSSPAGALGAAAMVIASLLPGAIAAGRASSRIDTTHATRDRLALDACIVRGVIIYTDPYIGGRLTNTQIVADIAGMCSRPSRIYTEDLGLDSAEAQRLLEQTIEAALRGQFDRETGQSMLRSAW